MPFASGTPGRRRGLTLGLSASVAMRDSPVGVCAGRRRAGEWPGPGGVVTTKVHRLVAGHHGAPSESAALNAFVGFTEPWGNRYPPDLKLWSRVGGDCAVPVVRQQHSHRGVHDQRHCYLECSGGCLRCPTPVFAGAGSALWMWLSAAVQ